MADIVFHFTNPSPSGNDVPAEGWVECSLVVLELGAITRTIERFAVDLMNGRAVIPLSATPAGQAWRIAVNGVAGVGAYYKAVPAGTTSRVWSTLADIDPTTLEVSEPALAAWDATLAEVTALADEIREIGGGTASAAVDPDNPGVLIVTFATGGQTPTIPLPPTVTLHPAAPASVFVGATITLEAAATGTPAPSVRWQRYDGVALADIPGATSTKLVIANAQLTDSGKSYRAVFTNASGDAATNLTTVTVLPDPGSTPTLPSASGFSGSGGVIDGSGEMLVLGFTMTGVPTPTVALEHLPRNTTTGTWLPVANVTSIAVPGTGRTEYRYPQASLAGATAGDTFRVRAVMTNSQGSVVAGTLTVQIFDVP